MLVWKSHHRAVVTLLQEQLKANEMLYKECLSGYQGRCAQMADQIEDLRKLVFAPVVKEVPREAREADAVISVSEKPIDMQDEEFTKIMEGIREADLIFSGNYEEGLAQ